MNAKKWMLIFLCVLLIPVLGVAIMVYVIDPYFHYRPPRDDIFYELKYERYINPGILKHFDYNALIIGTSMCQNFKTSEFDELYGVNSVKTCAQGAPYSEIRLLEDIGLEANPNLKTIVRGLDYNKLDWSEEGLETENLPMYLYDDSIWTDIEYLVNKETIVNMRVTLAQMLKNPGQGGMTFFDDYEKWMSDKSFGIDTVRNSIQNGSDDENVLEVSKNENSDTKDSLSPEDREKVLENIRQNITQAARDYPDTTFYMFFTPYSIFWDDLKKSGKLHRQIEMERCAIEEIFTCPNIRLYSFNLDHETVEDLDNYSDAGHYGEWVNSHILEQMKDGEYILTKENYEGYLSKEEKYYSNYDYGWLWEECEESDVY